MFRLLREQWKREIHVFHCFIYKIIRDDFDIDDQAHYRLISF